LTTISQLLSRSVRCVPVTSVLIVIWDPPFELWKCLLFRTTE